MSISVLLLPRKDAPVKETSARQVQTFPDLVQLIGLHTPAATKEPCPQFAPLELVEKAPDRKARSIASIHFGVLDYDDVPEDDLAALLARIDGRMPYVFLSSYSHGDPQKTAAAIARNPALGNPLDAFRAAWGPVTPPRLVRGRLVVPFTRPCPAGDWWRVWPHLARALEQGLAKPDPQAHLVTMAYYFPRHPITPHAPPIYLTNFVGTAFDVEWALAQPAPARLQRATELIEVAFRDLRGPKPATMDVTRHELRAHVQKLRRSQNQNRREVAVALAAICDGEAFAVHGNHDNMLFRVVSEITRTWPYAREESVAKLLAPSLQVMSPDNDNLAWVLDKLRRAQAEVRERVEGAKATRIREFFSGTRDTPYSDDELKCFADSMQSDTMQRLWVLQKGSSYYFFGGVLNGDGTCHEGRYFGPYVKEEMTVAARQVLAPASAHIVFEKTQDNNRAKTPAELVAEYGRVFKEVSVDLAADFTHYDIPRDTLVEAPCPLRDDIKPQYHPQVDHWLRTLAGPLYHRLCVWLAGASDLRRPATALYLEGKKGTGKTLLANGVARLWNKRGPSSLEACMAGDFNDAILNNPLLFSDEHPPKDHKGRTRTGELRALIQERTRALKRKFLPTAYVLGAVRVMLAANNTELLSSEENLTIHDIEAIAERFFHLPVQPEAEALLQDWRARYGPMIDAWVEHDQIAEHVLYLRDTVIVPTDTRFIASGEAGELINTFIERDGVRSEVLAWLAAFLRDPSRLAQRSTARRLIRVYQGRLAVNASVFLEAGDVYPINAKPRTTRRIATALSALAIGDRVHLRDPDGSQNWYRIIDTKWLISHMQQTDQGNAEEVEARIAALERPAQRTGNAAN